jgi:surfactin synthase thioesterase subunit
LDKKAVFGAPTVRALAAVLGGRSVADTGKPGSWLIGKRKAQAWVRLYCFPHSGGSAGEYLRWLGDLPGVEVLGLQLPGRGARLAEEPPYSLAELTRALLAEVEFEGPYVFFGHSLGALAAYETTLALRAAGKPLPERLILSGFGAPHLHDPGAPIHELDGPQLLEAIQAEYGTLPPELTENAELRDITLKSLRADLAMVGTYRHEPAEPLDRPLTILGGADDHPTAGWQSAWQAYTTASFDLRVFPGDHFYFRERADDVRECIQAKLSQ